MEIVAFPSLKYQLELWFPEISALFDFCDLSRVVEKPTLPKKTQFGMGGEENSCPTRRTSVYGRCDSRGPGANMRTRSLMVCYTGVFQKERRGASAVC